jgi:arylsulfatase A-like enzyme
MARLPNVVVIMADQFKATASHLYGSRSCRTPSLERLARTGVRFDRAYTPQPLCVPARVSLWTGRWPHAHGARLNETPMPAGEPHAFHCWHRAGYTLGLIGKNHCLEDRADRELFDVWCEIGHEGLPPDAPARGMAWVRPEHAVARAHRTRRAMPRQAAAVSYAISDVDPRDASSGLVAAQAEAYLERHAGAERPFALWVSFPDPHTPYEVPRAYADLVPPETVALPPEPDPRSADLPERTLVLRQLLGIDDAPEHERRALIAVYHALVRFVDDGVGRILDTLARTGLARDTIVAFCSDHGDFAGEHGMTRKGGAFYDCLVRVPLIVAWPGRLPVGLVDDSPVNLVDLAPTLLRLQGLAIPRAMQGAPLPTVTDAPAREATFAEYGAGGPPCTRADLADLPRPRGLDAAKATLRWREAEGRRKMIRTRRHKFVTDPLGDLDELYDLETDPAELHNLARVPGHDGLIADLRERLLAWSIMTEDARALPLPPAAFERPGRSGSTA